MWNSDRWAGLVDGADCPICRRGHPEDVLLELRVAWVTAPRDAPLPGYVCLVAKRHAVEPFDLDIDAGHAFWDALMTVARGVSAVTHAVKLNYEIHGNTIPHLHVHVFPRFRGDPFEGRPIAPDELGFHRSGDDLEVLEAAISAAGRDR